MARARIEQFRYQIYKSEVRKIARERLVESELFHASDIDPQRVHYGPIDVGALASFDAWRWGPTDFPWRSVPNWTLSDYKGLDIALWYDELLCGLCYATPRRSKVCIRVVLLEGNPDRSHPLCGAVGALTMVVIDVYARALGLRQIEIERPAPGAVKLYQSLGFAFNPQGCLVMPVSE